MLNSNADTYHTANQVTHRTLEYLPKLPRYQVPLVGVSIAPSEFLEAP